MPAVYGWGWNGKELVNSTLPTTVEFVFKVNSGLEKAVTRMKRGEHAQIKVQKKYMERKSVGFPPDDAEEALFDVHTRIYPFLPSQSLFIRYL